MENYGLSFRENVDAKLLANNINTDGITHDFVNPNGAKLTPQLNKDTVQLSSRENGDGKFTFWEAAKNFGKGLAAPITGILKHPIMAAGMVLGTIGLCTVAPVAAPVMAIGFGALGAYQLGKGVYNAAKEYKKGNYDASEKSFQDIGVGFISTALTMLGIKSTAKIVAEAKVLSNSKSVTLTETPKTEITSMAAALKEHLSLVTTKEGWKSILHQFKPGTMKARLADFKKAAQIATLTQEQKIAQFKKSPEGIRRNSLSEAEIQTEMKTLFDQAFDELGIPKEYRPKFEVKTGEIQHGGSYQKATHTLELNPESYKAGVFELDDVVMHEATHAKEAMLRARLPQSMVEQLVKEQLRTRITSGETEKIIKSATFMTHMMKPPKLSAKLKQEFVRFADDNLYNNEPKLYDRLWNLEYNRSGKVRAKQSGNMSDYNKHVAESQKLEAEMSGFMAKIKKMVDENPDFAKQYAAEEEAVNALIEYSLSHHTRYLLSTSQKAPVDFSKMGALTAEETAQAIKSLRGELATMEGNAGISGVNGIFATDKQFNMYQFSPEEVLAQQQGNKFLIKNTKAKMEKMQKAGTLTPEEQARLQAVIDNAEQVIAYKTKGLEYYEAYTKLLNSPADEALKATVKALEKELNALNPDLAAQLRSAAIMHRSLPANIAVTWARD